MRHFPFSPFTNAWYRFYFFTQFLSVIGTWMQQTAIAWWVFDQSRSATLLGLAIFSLQFPTFLLAIIGGHFSDKHNRKKIVATTQIISLVQAILFAAISMSGDLSIGLIFLLNAILGMTNAFDVPARNALVYDLFNDRQQLSNAVALTKSIVNLGRLIGPAISGWLILHYGYNLCFWMNALSFIPLLLSLPLMKKRVQPSPSNATSITLSFRNCLPSIIRPLLYTIACNLAVIPFVGIMPAFAKLNLHGSVQNFGNLEGFIGLGAVGGTLLFMGNKSFLLSKSLLFAYGSVLGFSLILLSQTHNQSMANLLVFLAGFAMIAQGTFINITIHSSVNPIYRGRIIACFTMAFYGSYPAGALLIGLLSGLYGVEHILLVQGILSMALAVLYFFVPTHG